LASAAAGVRISCGDSTMTTPTTRLCSLLKAALEVLARPEIEVELTTSQGHRLRDNQSLLLA